VSLELKSPDFTASGNIPKQFTCEGADISPALSWDAPPAATQSFVLIADDPDAPVGTWVHWVLFGPPPGKPHRYFFKLYALDAKLNLMPGATKKDVERAMQGHMLAQGEYIGRFSR